MADIISLISLAMGGKSIASGYAQGKDIQRILSKLDSLDRSFRRLSSDILVPDKTLLVPEQTPNELILDLDEIRKNIAELKAANETAIITGQSVVPKSTVQAMNEDPWKFLRDVRPLQGAQLLNTNRRDLPVVFEYEGIRFVGWKNENEAVSEFSFSFNDSTGIWEPVSFRNIGRNERCPCGSGLRYKHCCGKLS